MWFKSEEDIAREEELKKMEEKAIFENTIKAELEDPGSTEVPFFSHPDKEKLLRTAIETAEGIRSRTRTKSRNEDSASSSWSSSNYSGTSIGSGCSSRSGQSKYSKYFMQFFWGVVALFWGWWFYLTFRYDNQTAQYILKKSLSSLWSPTGDPILNVITDTLLIIVGIAMGVGVLMGGILIIVALICIVISVLIISALVALAKVSITGTIVAFIIGIAILYYGSKYLYQKIRTN